MGSFCLYTFSCLHSFHVHKMTDILWKLNKKGKESLQAFRCRKWLVTIPSFLPQIVPAAAPSPELWRRSTPRLSQRHAGFPGKWWSMSWSWFQSISQNTVDAVQRLEDLSSLHWGHAVFCAGAATEIQQILEGEKKWDARYLLFLSARYQTANEWMKTRNELRVCLKASGRWPGLALGCFLIISQCIIRPAMFHRTARTSAHPPPGVSI